MGWGQYNRWIPVAAQYVRNIVSVNNYAVPTTHIAGQWTSGYVVGKAGIQFGLRNSNAWLFYNLDRNSQNGLDWARPAGCVQFYQTDDVTTAGSCQQGEILPDTGANSLYLTVGTPFSYPTRGGASVPSALPSGAKIVFHMGRRIFTSRTAPFRPIKATIFAQDNSVNPSGNFRVPGDYINPTAVAQSWDTYGSFVNTGKSFFDHMDMCFDVTDGWVGFRAAQAAPWTDI